MADFREITETARLARQGETVVATFRKPAFHCIFCGVLAKQKWIQLEDRGSDARPVWEAQCEHCGLVSFWHAYTNSEGEEISTLLYPPSGSAPIPHPDMPESVRVDYLEARSIADKSPRGACALLRVALQHLTAELGENDPNLNAAIGNLVRRGLDPGIQQALDALRVVGNNAVHPSELDLRDDPETAAALFSVLNFIIEQIVTRPRKLAELYAGLPEGARQAIAKRDGPAPAGGGT